MATSSRISPLAVAWLQALTFIAMVHDYITAFMLYLRGKGKTNMIKQVTERVEQRREHRQIEESKKENIIMAF